MRVAIGSDHGGFNLKAEIICYLKERQIEYKDFGTYSLDSVDYPDFARAVAGAVVSGDYDRGILCCGTGIGVSIAANKVAGIRAALCHDTFSARMASEHNNANIITLGERVIGPGLAREIVGAWLDSEFAGGRHARRIEKIAEIERNNKQC
ncbi:ribose 5-phosphate isomerase B [Desulfotruncus alcoholivorax]|uniref:ribose 5-phosphate isomerase B n=1 Tax=Desulfotruncus alcoholivorax TaxID=265477 RepID=UPI000409E761|nr:ribose 5-phosphate isomerase B [Desulfotruncus alcoholivorax]